MEASGIACADAVRAKANATAIAFIIALLPRGAAGVVGCGWSDSASAPAACKLCRIWTLAAARLVDIDLHQTAAAGVWARQVQTALAALVDAGGMRLLTGC